MEKEWAEQQREALEYEMTPPRDPGTYNLGKGVTQIVTLRNNTQPYSGWTDSIINKEEEKRRKEGFKAWCEESGHH